MKFYLNSLSKVVLICVLIALQACEKDPAPASSVGASGYFVVNEGGFGNSNSSISFYDRETNELTNDVFASHNSRALGDQAQGLTVFEGKAYIVVQNSAKIEVIDANDFTSKATITEGIESPRYFLAISSKKAYISDWGMDGETGTVRVLDLEKMKVTDTIATGKGANKMIEKDGKVYVANAGGYGTDQTIAIIDSSNDEVTGHITIGDNPSNMQFDKDGNLWVAGIGNYFDTNPWIAKVGTDNELDFRLDLPVLAYSGPTIAMNKAGDKFYYNYNGAVYAMETSATTLPTEKLIEKDFYGLAVDPFNDDLIGCEAPDFSSAGKIYIYRDNAVVFKSYVVGIAPNGVGFK